MENKAKDKQIFAGLSPWLFISLILLIYGLRLFPGLVESGIQDIRQTENFALNNIEYKTLLPFNYLNVSPN
jgi:hypothetical protein